MHPYHESTVGASLFYVGFGVPLLIIVTTELVRMNLKVNNENKLKLFGRRVPQTAQNIYKFVGLFTFGHLVTTLLTDVAKRVIGRLRPHFISVCNPVLFDGSTCADQKNLHRYIIDFSCGNAASNADKLNEMRLSFPSGHSSIAMFSMMFLAIYIQSRMNWKGSKLLKHLLQFCVVTLALFCALSRVSDYKHHCK